MVTQYSDEIIAKAKSEFFKSGVSLTQFTKNIATYVGESVPEDVVDGWARNGHWVKERRKQAIVSADDIGDEISAVRLVVYDAIMELATSASADDAKNVALLASVYAKLFLTAGSGKQTSDIVTRDMVLRMIKDWQNGGIDDLAGE